MAVVIALGALLVPRAAHAARERVNVALLTMGPGDPTFSKFGHNAIVVSVPGERTRVYNFGTFSFQSQTLFRDFLKGRLRYWLSVGSMRGTISSYRAQNRSLLLQELALSPEAAAELARALAENALPENRFYLYDHFRDNCATRVRDALDRATGGSLKRTFARPARQSYRDHALRLVADDWPLYLGLDIGLGPMVDQPITEWDEGFLPERLAESVRRVRIPGDEGEVPLVREERTLFAADREPVRDEAPVRAPLLGAIGIALGGLLGWSFRKRDARRARIAGGTLAALLGGVNGILGLLLAFLWLATNNEVAHDNANAFLSPVVALALVPLGIFAALGKPRAFHWLERTLLACVVLAAFGCVFALAVGQDIARTASLFTPIWLGGWIGLRLAARRSA